MFKKTLFFLSVTCFLLLSLNVSVLAATVYGNRLIDFNNHPAWTVYESTQVTKDFGNYRVLQGGNRLKIDNVGRLRFKLPKGSVGSSQGGGIIKADIAKKDTYTFEYEVLFDQNFPWSKGGKLPGLSGGVGYTGGTPAWNGDGFSVRIMWREDGRLIPNVYHKEQPGNYGDTFGATIGYLTDDKPHKIKYWVKLNTGSNHNGILKIYLDDELKFEKRDIVYRTDDSKIDTAHIAVFPGGSTKDWKMTETGYIRFNWIKWE